MGSSDELGSEVALSANGQAAVLGDAPFTGADAIDGAALLFTAPAGSYQALQSIVFTSGDPSPASSGATYTPAATATSGLPVAFSVDAASTPGACSLQGATVNFTGSGSCLLDANQQGDAAWASAPEAQMDVSVQGRPPSVVVLSSSATVDGTRIPVKLSCKNAPCSGNAELVKLEVVLAKAPYSIREGKRATVGLVLTAAGTKAFADALGHPLLRKLVVVTRGGKRVEKTVRIS
jgi:hypothetical protein